VGDGSVEMRPYGGWSMRERRQVRTRLNGVRFEDCCVGGGSIETRARAVDEGAASSEDGMGRLVGEGDAGGDERWQVQGRPK